MSLRCFSVSTTASNDISIVWVLLFAPKTLWALLTSRSSSLNDVNAFAMIAPLFQCVYTHYQYRNTPSTLSVERVERASCDEDLRNPVADAPAMAWNQYSLSRKANGHRAVLPIVIKDSTTGNSVTVK